MSSSIRPKCAGTMQAGFMIDRGYGNALTPAYWQDGTPEKSFWTGLKMKGHQ